MSRGNRDFNFSWKFKNFEIRTVHDGTDKKNLPLRKEYPVELVKYFDERHDSCYVVAMFKLEDEGYELHFVGNRPMKDIEPEEMCSIWRQLQAAQKMLDAYFKACKDEAIDFD